jgi:hypothetical protein
MAKDSVTSTELARKTSQIMERLSLTGESLQITKGRRVIGELHPPKRGCPISRLESLFLDGPQLGDDAKSFREDIDKMQAPLPGSEWE